MGNHLLATENMARKLRRSGRIKIKQHDVADCAAACLASILAWYRRDVPIARIRQYASTDQKGTTAWGIIQAAQKLNLSAKGVRGDLGALPDIPLPAIAHVVVRQRLQHYVVIYRVSKTNVQVMDPATGTLDNIPLSTFKESWTGVLILLGPDDGFRPGSEKASVAARFMYLLKPHKAILWQVLTGALLFTVLGLSTSIFLQKIVDHVIPDGNRNLLNLMGIAMVSILAVKLVINHARTILTINTGQQIDARLILGYYKHLLRLP